MSLSYITEAFRCLELLNEEAFTADDAGINELSSFLNSDKDVEQVTVIDPDAETEEDLQTSYVGKVIINCNICHSNTFKDKVDVHINSEGVVNAEDQCGFCGEQEGFTIMGEVMPYTPADEHGEPTEAETNTESSDVVEESVNVNKEVSLNETYYACAEIDGEERRFPFNDRDDARKYASDIKAGNRPEFKDKKVGSVWTESVSRSDISNALTEDVNNVNVETDDSVVNIHTEDNGKVTVTTEPKENVLETEEVIVPVSDDTESEIINNSEEIAIEEVPEESADMFTDFDIEEIDEESIDDLGESYLKKVYENVDSFKTSRVSATENKLVVEGLITFKSGTKKNTGFIFEAKDANKNGKVRFIGENTQLCRARKAFTLTGNISDKKLIAESFTYNYRAKNSAGKPTRVYGTVSHKK